jgi:hypothetical protein
LAVAAIAPVAFIDYVEKCFMRAASRNEVAAYVATCVTAAAYVVVANEAHSIPPCL